MTFFPPPPSSSPLSRLGRPTYVQCGDELRQTFNLWNAALTVTPPTGLIKILSLERQKGPQGRFHPSEPTKTSDGGKLK